MRRVFGFLVLAFVIGLVIRVGLHTETAKASEGAPKLTVNKPKLDMCNDVLNYLAKKTGALKTYDVDGKIGTVEVREAYYRTTFDSKENLNTVLRCVMTDGRQDTSVDYIDYIDYRTHKSVAHWSSSLGLTVE